MITQGGTSQTEAEFERDDATRVHIRTTRVLIDGPDRPNQYLLGLSEDITSMRKTEAARWRLANYDTLTGLLNRGSMLAQIERLIEAEHRFAILNIDLDRFKSVNDQFGHVTGDEVLKVVGARLADLSDENTQIARIGGEGIDGFRLFGREAGTDPALGVDLHFDPDPAKIGRHQGHHEVALTT